MTPKLSLVPLFVAAVLSSCTTYTTAVDPTPQIPARAQPASNAAQGEAATEAKAEENKAAETKAAEAKKEEAKKEAAAQRKKVRDVDYARLQLDLAKHDAVNEVESSKRSVATAERELAAAKSEYDNFKKVVMALEIDERELAVDRAKQNTIEAEQELAELEAMYKQEEFAGTTKELVLNRGRTQLAMSKRNLELAKRRAEQLREFEHKKRDKELAERVAKAEVALSDASTKTAKVEVAQRLALLKAEHALEDAERELADQQAATQKAATP